MTIDAREFYRALIVRLASVTLAAFVLACSESGSPPRTQDSAGNGEGEPHARTALDSTIIAIRRGLRPVDSAFASLHFRLRQDSGTPRADSILVEIQDSLVMLTHHVAAKVADSAVSIRLWPDGSRAQRYRRAEASAGRSVPPADTLVADSLRRVLLAHGIWSYTAEGGGYFRPSFAQLLSVAFPYVTESARAALRIQQREQELRFADDGSIMIPWDSLADRLAAADQYLATFATAAARASIQDYRASYLLGFLTGFESSSVFEGPTRSLSPAARASFERFLVLHPSTASATVVRAYLDVLARNRFRRTRAVSQFLWCEPSFRDTRCRRQ